MSINTIIEEQKKSLPKMIVDLVWSVTDGGCKLIESGIQSYQEEPIREYEDILDWHIKSIKQILDSEIERLNKEDTDLWFDSEHCKEKDKEYYELKREFVNNQITHLTNIIKEIK